MICSEIYDRFVSDVLRHDVSEAVAARLKNLGRPLRVRKGEAARVNEESDQLVFVESGATKLVAHASADREQVVAFHFAGDLVSVPAKADHAYTLWALENAQLVVFPAREFLTLSCLEPDILAAVLERVLIALHRCRDKTVGIGRKTAQERVASFLMSMAERIGHASEEGCTLALPMSRRDIGDSLGLTIETVSRQFSDLRKRGLVVTSGRSCVTLTNLPALASQAGHHSVGP